MFFRRSISRLNAATKGRSSETTWALQLILNCSTLSVLPTRSASDWCLNEMDALIVSSEPHSATLWVQFSILCAEQWNDSSAHPEAACFSQISQQPVRRHAVSADPTHKRSLAITQIPASWRTWNIWDNPLSHLSADTWKGEKKNQSNTQNKLCLHLSRCMLNNPGKDYWAESVWETIHHLSPGDSHWKHCIQLKGINSLALFLQCHVTNSRQDLSRHPLEMENVGTG